jgi:translation elongation factor EF-Tu-like GTPase
LNQFLGDETMNSQPTVTFEMPVESLARITGRGVMFVGHIRIGAISVGERVEVISAEQQSTATVVGIARMPSHELVQCAEQGEEVGILVNEFNLDKAGPGVQSIENQYVPVNLILRAQNC